MNISKREKNILKSMWIDATEKFDKTGGGEMRILKLIDLFLKLVPDGQSVNDFLGIEDKKKNNIQSWTKQRKT